MGVTLLLPERLVLAVSRRLGPPFSASGWLSEAAPFHQRSRGRSSICRPATPAMQS